MPMDINQQKEQFSLAYVHAVASATGYSVYDPRVDDQSVDIGLMGYEVGCFCEAPRLEIQAKCTESPTYIDGETQISYTLSRKNYDDLIKRTAVPRILVVVIVPNLVTDWIVQSNDDLVLKRCGYWVSLNGCAPLSNASQRNRNVKIPLANVFSGSALKEIMTRIADGGQP